MEAMLVHRDLTIQDIKEEFTKKFPGLKLEMYKVAHKEGQGSLKSAELAHDLKLGDINAKLLEKDYDFDPSMAVSEFEAEFEEQFGLFVQVFRRSNNLWLQTSTTDDWTLEKQNIKGLNSVQV